MRWTCLLLLGLAACSSITVASDHDAGADFSSYQSYTWLPEEHAAGGDPRLSSALLSKRVHAAVDREMEAKGLSRDARPDLFVTWRLVLEEKVRVIDHGPSYAFGYGWRRGWYQPRDLDVDQYTVGTLILDFVDAGTKELVWRGWGSGTVDPAGEPDEERLGEAVRKILAEYPPK